MSAAAAVQLVRTSAHETTRRVVAGCMTGLRGAGMITAANLPSRRASPQACFSGRRAAHLHVGASPATWEAADGGQDPAAAGSAFPGIAEST